LVLFCLRESSLKQRRPKEREDECPFCECPFKVWESTNPSGFSWSMRVEIPEWESYSVVNLWVFVLSVLICMCSWIGLWWRQGKILAILICWAAFGLQYHVFNHFDLQSTNL